MLVTATYATPAQKNIVASTVPLPTRLMVVPSISEWRDYTSERQSIMKRTTVSESLDVLSALCAPAKSPTLDEAMDVIRKALDWNCPFCGEQNSTEKPDKVLQCTWCMKKVPAKLVE